MLRLGVSFSLFLRFYVSPLVIYDCPSLSAVQDKVALDKTKEKLLTQQEKFKNLSWEHEMLLQKFEKVL